MENQTNDESYLESNWDQSIQKFEDLNLHADLLRGIFGYGFVKPSVIQQKGILPIIQKKDTIAQAQSGSGKTATFTIGLLQLIEPAELKIQAMVLAPTRELADQIKTFMQCVGTYLNIKVHLCTGGTDIAEDRRAFQEGVHVVVGTPGRVYDMIKREYLNTNYLRIMVLDEADEMLGRGFLDQVNEILKQVPSDTQICMFSATMPPEVIKMTDGIMTDPAKILVKNEDITLAGKNPNPNIASLSLVLPMTTAISYLCHTTCS